MTEPRRETVREMLERAPKVARPPAPARPARRRAEARRMAAESGAAAVDVDESEAALVVALRDRLEEAARGVVAEERFAIFRHAKSGFRFDATSRGVGAWIAMWRED